MKFYLIDLFSYEWYLFKIICFGYQYVYEKGIKDLVYVFDLGFDKLNCLFLFFLCLYQDRFFIFYLIE